MITITGHGWTAEGEVLAATTGDVYVRYTHADYLFKAWFNRLDGQTGFPHGVAVDPLDVTLEKVPADPPTPRRDTTVTPLVNYLK